MTPTIARFALAFAGLVGFAVTACSSEASGQDDAVQAEDESALRMCPDIWAPGCCYNGGQPVSGNNAYQPGVMSSQCQCGAQNTWVPAAQIPNFNPRRPGVCAGLPSGGSSGSIGSSGSVGSSGGAGPSCPHGKGWVSCMPPVNTAAIECVYRDGYRSGPQPANACKRGIPVNFDNGCCTSQAY